MRLPNTSAGFAGTTVPVESQIVFLDSSILIAAFGAKDAAAHNALDEISKPGIEFASSDFVKLEVLPLPAFHRRISEVEFYESYFAIVRHWASLAPDLAQRALEEGAKAGLGAVDALHVAAALSLGASEIVTTEKAAKPFARVKSIRVRTIA